MSVWLEGRDGDPRARRFYERHYSCRRYRDGRKPTKLVGPGEYIMLVHLSADLAYDALFVWRRFISDDGQTGVNCAVFRNESAVRSSILILAAEAFAVRRWGAIRAYTYINPRRLRSSNPGFCFRCAGWTKCGTTHKQHLIIMEKHLCDPA